MKQIKWYAFAFMLAGAFAACSSPSGEKATTGDAAEESQATEGSATYVLDEGIVFWEGSKPAGTHTGTIKVSDAQLNVENGELIAGNFSLDLGSLEVTDLQGEDKGKLEGHLKSPDFFDAATHPSGTFVISSVEKVEGESGITHRITGNLTLKGVTKSVTIPAEIAISDDSFSAKTPKFVIDRTQWNIMWGSESVIDKAKDALVNDQVGLEIGLKATKS